MASSISRVKIRVDPDPLKWMVVVDGHDVTDLCFALRLEGNVGESPSVFLGLYATNENGNFYKDERRNEVARQFLHLEPDEVILEGDIAVHELVAHVTRRELGKKKAGP